VRHYGILTPGFDFPRPARSLLKALFWCQALAITWFALWGGEEQARLQWLFGLDDHAMHLAAFLLASTTAFLLWAPLGAVAVLLAMSAASIELAQALLPARQPSLTDFSASSLGIVAGAVAARLVWPVIASRVSRR
jgi:hypothetical protein